MPPPPVDGLAPDFTLPTHRGDTFRLYQSLRPRAFLLLLFFRGYW